MTAPQSLPVGSKLLKFTAVALAALSWWVVPADSTSKIPSRDVYQMRAILQQSIAEMNAQGRLPLTGVAGGMVNNIWQTISHPNDPARLGCGWQSDFVLNRLNGMPGWRFEHRYEVGFNSPILLPHQWLTGYGPNGQTIQIDPWDGITEAK
jgi:hypothetical protein